jgi:hypothetical protein
LSWTANAARSDLTSTYIEPLKLDRAAKVLEQRGAGTEEHRGHVEQQLVHGS